MRQCLMLRLGGSKHCVHKILIIHRALLKRDTEYNRPATGSRKIAIVTDNEEPHKPNLRNRYANLSVPNKVITAVLAIGAALTTMWGAFQAVEGVLGVWREWRDAPTELSRTPRLGLEFWQEGNRNDMFFSSEAGKEKVRVPLTPEPFEMRFPKPDERNGLQVNGWVDDSNFTAQQGTRLDAIMDSGPEGPEAEDVTSPFLYGQAMADYQYGSGQLFLRKYAYMYLAGTRVEPTSGGKAKAYFSTVEVAVYGKDWYTPTGYKAHSLTEQNEDIFLTVFTDMNENGVIDVGEYEYIVLDF
jgi:hypothetical protein